MIYTLKLSVIHVITNAIVLLFVVPSLSLVLPAIDPYIEDLIPYFAVNTIFWLLFFLMILIYKFSKDNQPKRYILKQAFLFFFFSISAVAAFFLAVIVITLSFSW